MTTSRASIANSLDTWKSQFLHQHVQPLGTSGGANFISGESVVLFSGPPVWDETNTTVSNLVPIGLVQSAQVSQSKQLQQIYEIGSRKPLMIPGRTQIQAQLSRVLFDGPSLLKAVSVKSITGTTLAYSGGTLEAEEDPRNQVGDVNTPANFWINLASNYFNKPLGLGFAIYDMESQVYGGFFMEECYIRSHQFGVAAQQTVLAESISLVASQIRPLDISLFTSREPGDTAGDRGDGRKNLI